jgi:acyl-CoA thioesterase-2
VMGDFVPSGVGQALGLAAGGSSLDNTLRVVSIVPTEWVLADIRIHAVDHGFGHGLAHLWAEDGSLLATASQSVIVRYWDGAEPRERTRRQASA